MSSENVHVFTHVVLFVYHTGINFLTVHVFFNKWLVVSCGRQMFCCLHSSFLGEWTFVTAFIHQRNNAGFLHLSPLPSVQGKSLFHFVGTPPKLKKKKLFIKVRQFMAGSRQQHSWKANYCSPITVSSLVYNYWYFVISGWCLAFSSCWILYCGQKVHQLLFHLPPCWLSWPCGMFFVHHDLLH